MASKVTAIGKAVLLFMLSGAVTNLGKAQDALVTIYSHGSNLTSGIPGTHHDVYNGNIFDGDQGLFSFFEGRFEHNNRFLTFRLPPGPHTFGASNGRRPVPRETLLVDLKPGEHYFIRAQGESAGVPVLFTVQHGRLDLMPCKDAQIDLKKAQPLKDKALWKYARARQATLVVTESSPPPCP